MRYPNTSQRLPTLVRLLVMSACVLELAGATSVDNLIQKVEARYNGAQSLRVRFTENYSLLGHPRPPESGVVTLKKKGKMRWDYDRPAGKLFLSDGKNVYLYTAADHRVEKVPLKETEDMRAPLGFLLGRLDLRKEFGNFTLQDDVQETRLGAAAKNERAPYEQIEMIVARSGEIKHLTVKGRDQSVLAYSFENEVLNPPVPDSIFRFEVPADAQVVNAIEAHSEAK